jgi:hypothetical protein
MSVNGAPRRSIKFHHWGVRERQPIRVLGAGGADGMAPVARGRPGCAATRPEIAAGARAFIAPGLGPVVISGADDEVTALNLMESDTRHSTRPYGKRYAALNQAPSHPARDRDRAGSPHTLVSNLIATPKARHRCTHMSVIGEILVTISIAGIGAFAIAAYAFDNNWLQPLTPTDRSLGIDHRRSDRRRRRTNVRSILSCRAGQ